MIKCYCDKCGKEITEGAKKVVEEIEAVDIDGNTIVKFPKVTHICDECQDDLTCGFKVGDQVITDDGRVGIIESFCDCPSCEIRGFYEPRIKMEIGDDPIWITDTDKNNGFKHFYRIGDRVFGNIDEQYVRDNIYNLKKQLIEYESRLEVVKKLKKEKENEKSCQSNH